MSPLPRVTVILLPLWCGCVASGWSDAGRSPALGIEPTAGAHDVAAGGPEGGSQVRRATGAGGDELALWNEPDFRRRFAESYLAVSDVEPPALNADETDSMNAVLALRGEGKLDEAIATMRKEVGSTSNARLDLTLAKLLIERERFGDAAVALEACVAKFDKFRRAWNDLGLIHFREGNYAPAARAFARVIELGGGDAQVYGLLGVAHAKNDDQVAAESAFRMAILLDPTSAGVRIELAKSFFSQARYADAATLLGALIGQQPDRGELWLLQAQAYIGLGKADKAAENLEIADRLGKTTAESLNTLGNVYVNEGIYDLAASAYARAMAKDEKAGLRIGLDAAKALVSRGANAETQHLLDRIDAAYGKQLDARQQKATLWLRSRLALATGAGQEAEAKVLEQIVALDPLDGDALLKLGRYHERRGEIEEAVFRYRHAAALPEFEADSLVCEAQLLVRQGKSVEALPLLRRAQSLRPRDNVQQFLEQVEGSTKSR